MTLTFYLFAEEAFSLVKNLSNCSSEDLAPKNAMQSFILIMLSLVIQYNVMAASDEFIIHSQFWQIECFTAFFMWTRFIFVYLA